VCSEDYYMQPTLLAIRQYGFREQQTGKIHIRCPECGRKRSNVPRAFYDPEEAWLLETLCERCCNKLASLDPPTDYYNYCGCLVEEKL
jgi:hypothetical protein